MESTNGINSLAGYLKYDTDVFETIGETAIEGLNSWQPSYNSENGKITLVKNQLSNEFDLKNTQFLILAGNNYLHPIEDIFELEPDLPLKNLGLGKRLKWLNSKITK